MPTPPTTDPMPEPDIDEAPTDGKGKLARFEKKLEKLGYKIVNGKIVNPNKAGPVANDEVLQLLQVGWNRFGLTNQQFDPTRVAYSGQSDQTALGRVGRFVDLATGVYTTGTGVASDARLAYLQANSGYDPEVYRQYLVDQNSFERQIGVNEKGRPIYETYTPAAFRTPESFATYTTAARQNYLNPEPQPTNEEMPPLTPSLDELDTESLSYVSDTLQQMLQSRKQRESARSFMAPFFDFSDFETE